MSADVDVAKGMEDRGDCPWNGKPCPGVEFCTPAVMKADMMNAGTDPEIDQQVEPICPIVELTDAGNRASLAVQPLINLVLGMDEPKEETEDERRARVINDLKMDQ